MTEIRTCKHCGRGEAEHPDLKWNSRTQCTTCHNARREEKLADENVLKTCKHCGRDSRNDPDLKWHRHTQCRPCRASQRKEKLADENVFKTCRDCGRDSRNDPDLTWYSYVQCRPCRASQRKEKLADENVFKTCRDCGRDSRNDPDLKWHNRGHCKPCSVEKYYGHPWQRALRAARSRASDILGGAKFIPESLDNLEIFKQHMEGKFYSPQMVWERFGPGRGRWQVDHVLPVSDFNPDIHDPETYFGLTNIQPLWYRHNASKANLEPEAVSLVIKADRLLWAAEDLPSERKAASVLAAKKLLDEVGQIIEKAIQLFNEEYSKCQKEHE